MYTHIDKTVGVVSGLPPMLMEGSSWLLYGCAHVRPVFPVLDCTYSISPQCFVLPNTLPNSANRSRFSN